MLAELSTHTAVLVTPRPDTDVLEHVEFVRLREGQLLAVLVAKSGQVSNKIIATTEPISAGGARAHPQLPEPASSPA